MEMEIGRQESHHVLNAVKLNILIVRIVDGGVIKVVVDVF